MATMLAQEDCAACSGETCIGVTDDDIKALHLDVPMWEVGVAISSNEGRSLHRSFEFEQYADAVTFVNHVADAAAAQKHHPTITLSESEVTVEWWTHALHDLHRNDFIMAAKTDEAYLALLDETRKKSTVQEASEQSFPASDSPGWIGKTAEDESAPPA